MDEQQRISTKAILNSVLHNIGVVQDQIESLNDDYEMPDIVQQLKEAGEAVQKELDVLDA